MMNVKDVAARALTRPQIYVPALVDEIQHLRTQLAMYESAFSDIKSLALSSDLWTAQSDNSVAWVRRLQRLAAEIQSDSGCSP